MSLLTIENQTADILSYLNGTIVVPGFSSVSVSSEYFFELCTDAQFKSDIGFGYVQVTDGVTNYGTVDALKYIESIPGLKDNNGLGITSTAIVTGIVPHQALDVNIVSGTSTGSTDNSTFTYSDSVQQTLGGVYNDTGAAVTSGRTAAARITEQRALHVNLRDSQGQEIVPASVSSLYSEVTNIASGITTLVQSLTVTDANKALQKIEFSGTNIAEFELVISGQTVDKKRTYFGSSLNGIFDFNSGLKLSPSDIVEIYVVHNRPFPGEFNCRIQLLEKQ